MRFVVAMVGGQLGIYEARLAASDVEVADASITAGGCRLDREREKVGFRE